MDAAQRQLSDQIDDATQRLLGTARVITESGLREPSLLPGWTRARVLAHLARGADAMRELLIGARSGQERPGYASDEARQAAIEDTARQPARAARACRPAGLPRRPPAASRAPSRQVPHPAPASSTAAMSTARQSPITCRTVRTSRLAASPGS